MLYSCLLIVSRESALKTIRRTSGFFIWTPLIIMVLGSFDFFDAWLKSNIKAETSASSIELVAGLIGYIAGRLVRDDWLYILCVANALFLRRYKSRVAAALFVLVSFYSVGLGLWMVRTMWSAHVSQQLFITGILLTVVSFLSLLIAARALAAAVKLQRVVDDPILSSSTQLAPHDQFR
jgi:hypothetical protein